MNDELGNVWVTRGSKNNIFVKVGKERTRIYKFSLIGSCGWMFNICVVCDLIVGSLLIRGCDRFERNLGKRYRAASRLCTIFFYNPRNRLNLVDFWEVFLFREGAMRCKSIAAPPCLSLSIFFLFSWPFSIYILSLAMSCTHTTQSFICMVHMYGSYVWFAWRLILT